MSLCLEPAVQWTPGPWAQEGLGRGLWAGPLAAQGYACDSGGLELVVRNHSGGSYVACMPLVSAIRPLAEAHSTIRGSASPTGAGSSVLLHTLPDHGWGTWGRLGPRLQFSGASLGKRSARLGVSQPVHPTSPHPQVSSAVPWSVLDHWGSLVQGGGPRVQEGQGGQLSPHTAAQPSICGGDLGLVEEVSSWDERTRAPKSQDLRPQDRATVAQARTAVQGWHQAPACPCAHGGREYSLGDS